ncbi:MAG: hypothetical protein CSA34_01245 [Desulfobulbus propionicus]|nr:MAG: hypothetical protein CSA34_01245 [Desulfobulbus propionicus]
MKNVQETPETTEFNDIEDLTLFADENFDTDDVDLFEFTGEDDSPLTRLKSIILSLDWEINDETLQELAEEVVYLQESMQGDKIAKLYLQGLEKIGRYLRSEGAYAHPNSIKLLLTFFYDFEKLSSSDDLTDDDITLILKQDVRKFKILQYQISKQLDTARSSKEMEELRSVEEAIAAGAEVSEKDRLKLLRATILSLDWEVSDEGLKQFQDEVHHYKTEITSIPQVSILAKGLYVLGKYIAEEKGKAHPESFTMLHSFYSGIEELIVKNNELDDKKRNKIIVDKVQRLNALKALIAGHTGSSPADPVVDEVVDEIIEPQKNELAEELTDKEVVSEEAPAIMSEEQAIAPALAEAEDEPDRERDLRATQEEELDDELASQLDSFFQLDEEPELAKPADDLPEEILDPSAITPFSDKVADTLIEQQLAGRRDLTPALADVSEEDTLLEEEWEDEATEEERPQTATIDDFEKELNQLFDDDGEPVDDASLSGSIDLDKGPVTLVDAAIQTSAASLGNKEDAGEFFDKNVTPALVNSDEEQGFNEAAALAGLEDSPTTDLDEKLNSFFDVADDDEEQELPVPTAEEPIAPVNEQEDSLGETLDNNLEDQLETFFEDTEETPETITSASVDEAPAAKMAAAEPVAALADVEVDVETLDDATTVDDMEGMDELALNEDLDVLFGEDLPEEEEALAREFAAEPAEGSIPSEEDKKINQVELPVNEQAVAEKTDDIEVELQEDLDLLIKDDTPGNEDSEKSIVRLAALLPSLVKVTGEDDQLGTCASLVEEVLKDPAYNSGQKAYAHLVSSVLRLLPLKHSATDAETENLLEFLKEQMQEEGDLTNLAKAMDRLTSWQVSLINEWATAPEGANPEDIRNAYRKLTQEVRATMENLQKGLTEHLSRAS